MKQSQDSADRLDFSPLRDMLNQLESAETTPSDQSAVDAISQILEFQEMHKNSDSTADLHIDVATSLRKCEEVMIPGQNFGDAKFGERKD